eukprot:6209296-Pleurochrysis_carterae.AAC.2
MITPAHHPQGGGLDECQYWRGGRVAYTSQRDHAEGCSGSTRMRLLARVAESDDTYQPASTGCCRCQTPLS